MKRIKLLLMLLFRNAFCREGCKANRKRVNLEYYRDDINLGDALAPVIFMWMLKKKGIDADEVIEKTKHLLTVGSIIDGRGYFDATIWGSGIRTIGGVYNIGIKRYFRKLDIRAVRGPITREILVKCGYECPLIYGDPGILMPLIYEPEGKKSSGIGIVRHFHEREEVLGKGHDINIRTTDYKSFLDQVVSCEKIIS